MLRKDGRQASRETAEASVVIQVGDTVGKDQNANASVRPPTQSAFCQIA